MRGRLIAKISGTCHGQASVVFARSVHSAAVARGIAHVTIKKPCSCQRVSFGRYRSPVEIVFSQADTAKEGDMSEFLQNYGFFILIAIVMVFCHMAHGTHGHKDQDSSKREPGGGEHPH